MCALKYKVRTRSGWTTTIASLWLAGERDGRWRDRDARVERDLANVGGSEEIREIEIIQG